jgi:hypothetical protein
MNSRNTKGFGSTGGFTKTGENFCQTPEEMTEALKGTKFDDDKLRLELIPVEFLWLCGAVLTMGGIKYDAWNWFKGFEWSRAYGAILRHLTAAWGKEDFDDESKLLHLGHAAVEIMFMVMFQIHGKGIDDRPIEPKFTQADFMQAITQFKEELDESKS